MVIDIDHPHTHNEKYAPYAEVYGPQGPMIKYKGPAFSCQLKQPLGCGLEC